MGSLKILPVILSRIGSTRLPAKSLLLIRPKITILENLVLQLNLIENLDKPVLATSDYDEDNVLASYADQLDLKVIRGPHDNVIKRLYMAAISEGADYVLRVNSDSIIIDQDLINSAIIKLRDCDGDYDYITNLKPRTYPYGISLQIISRRLLQLCLNQDLSNDEKEHITPAIDKYVDSARRYNITLSLAVNYSNKKIVVDTLDDYVRMFELFSCRDVAKLDYRWYVDPYLLKYLDCE
jgi:spore coat polysaccharide biosynthesis protein SpsF (cytidylyltransferase family)